MKQKESTLKSACLEYLAGIGAKAVPIRSIGIKKPNGQWIPYKEKGVSDILACYKGKALAIECKIKPSKVKKGSDQERFLQDWDKAGGFSFVVFEINDLVVAINQINNSIEYLGDLVWRK